MKNKTTLIQGIIFCAQSIIIDAVALYAMIPLLANLWFGDLYGDEKTAAVFSLAVWIGISIGVTITLYVGRKKIFEYFSDSSSAADSTPTYSNTSYNTPIFKDSNTPAPVAPKPTATEWKCPKCGKINQNYTGTCGCGQQKPNR